MGGRGEKTRIRNKITRLLLNSTSVSSLRFPFPHPSPSVLSGFCILLVSFFLTLFLLLLFCFPTRTSFCLEWKGWGGRAGKLCGDWVKFQG